MRDHQTFGCKLLVRLVVFFSHEPNYEKSDLPNTSRSFRYNIYFLSRKCHSTSKPVATNIELQVPAIIPTNIA